MQDMSAAILNHFIKTFAAFGLSTRRFITFEQSVDMLSGNKGFIDLFWEGVLLVEQKSEGRNLDKAKQQALGYCRGLSEDQLPRYLLTSDFKSFELFDLEEGTTTKFQMEELPDLVETHFGFVLGRDRRAAAPQDEVSVKASQKIAALHDELAAANYTGHKLEIYLTRLVFCLFADDTGIFPERDMFLYWLENQTSDDGQGLGAMLNEVFQILDTPEDERSPLLGDFHSKLPHVNGALFAETLRAPTFDRGMRLALIEASKFNWEPISPAIFGSLFQGVMDGKERREKGAHYTEEEHIMRVIGPLFLDELHGRYDSAVKLKNSSERKRRLIALRKDMAALNLFDPACGCGNFLVLAYRELRRLELKVLKILHPREAGETMDALAVELSALDVDQFHGIEIDEFPTRIAETAMWMMDHLMNRELSDHYGRYLPRLPLEKKANIRHGDALLTDWADVISPEKCSYIFGNPPFRGKTEMSEEQRDNLYQVVQASGSTTKELDFVAGWYLKAVQYVAKTERTIPIAFVSTNSITQGQQVALLWPLLLDKSPCKQSIGFAHRTFEWSSEAKGKAHVHCTIVGLWPKNDMPKRRILFDYPDIKGQPEIIDADVISPYLFESGGLANPEMVIPKSTKAPAEMPKTLYGNKPADGGNLILSEDEAKALRKDKTIRKYVRRMVDNKNYLNGRFRYCLWLEDSSPSERRANDVVKERLKAVRKMREESDKPQTQELALTPWLFAEIRQPTKDYIVIPRHTSERREYVPFGFFGSSDIVHDSCTCVPDGGTDTYALMTSAMHMAWMRYTCGRIKSDYRYAGTLVYNTMPWPELNKAKRKRLEKSGQKIIDAREKWIAKGQTLVDLYDPMNMPKGLRKAHRENDALVDSLYSRANFSNERKRIEYLFKEYEARVLPMLVKKKKKRKKS